MYASEFGQNTWDELNLITAGGNYGWPDVEGPGARTGFIEPQQVWPTDEASPSGIAFWQGSIWMAGLRGERLWQIPIVEGVSGPTTGAPIAHLTGAYGRLRTVAAAPESPDTATVVAAGWNPVVGDGAGLVNQLPRFVPVGIFECRAAGF